MNIIVKLISSIQNHFKQKTIEPSFSIRPFLKQDLEHVYYVETYAFDAPHYPIYFFIQVGEVFKKTFLVAESSNGEIIGYGIGALEQGANQKGWIFSIGVLPAWRRKKVGTVLMKALTTALEESGANIVFCPVKENNLNAIALYTQVGFSIYSKESKYFGHGESRIIMQKERTPFRHQETTFSPELLISEVETGISFVNVLFGVSAAIVAFLATRENAVLFVVPLFYLFFVFFSSLYSSIFYANVTGSISRLGKLKEISQPIRYGNVISEYFGVYPLIVAFPLIVWNSTNNYIIAIISLGIDLVGFIFYQVSGFDILSRIIKSKFIHRSLTFMFALMLGLQLFAEIADLLLLRVIVLSLITTFFIILTVVGIRLQES